MSALKIKENVYSVGVLNPNMRIFDIVMKTEYGTSYNAYLVKGSEKTALIETVHLDFFEDYIHNIEEVCPLEQIDCLIMNHNEPDHSGAIEKLCALLPNLKIYISQAGSIYLKNIANRELNIQVVKDGESIDLGGKTLHFINAPFLHWPDSMFTWLPEDKILFPCDFLGAHYCEPRMVDVRMRQSDWGKYTSAMVNYYNAIFSPFKPYVLKGLEKIKDLDIEYVCTSHGPILTKGGSQLSQVLEFYRSQSQPELHTQKRIPIFYTSAYHNTGELAKAIAEGVQEAFPDAEVEFYDIIHCSMDELAAKLNSCDGCLIGSPTINRDAVPPVWNLLAHVDAVNFAKRPVALFGSYGWSGEAIPNLRGRLEGLKAKVFDTDFRVVFVPTEEELQKAREFGKAFAESV